MDDERDTFDPQELLAHAGWVRGLAARLVFDAGQVDDVVQETWLAALGSRPRGPREPRAWLAGILRNVVRRRLREDGRRRRRETRVAADRPPFDEGRDLVAEAELHRRMVDAVLALDEPYRSTVLALDLAGRSAAELAAAEGVPAATVRSRHARALARLRARLDAEHGDRRTWSLALLPLIGLEPTTTAGLTAAATGTSGIGRLIALASKGVPLVTAKLTAVLVTLSAVVLLGVLGPSGAPDAPTTTGVLPVVVAPGPAALAHADAAVDPAPVSAEPAERLRAAPPAAAAAPLVGRPVTFSGRVLDETGAPVAGARIDLLPDGWTLAALGFPGHATGMHAFHRDSWSRLEDEPYARFASVSSDSDGRFRLRERLVLWHARTWRQSSYRYPELVVRAPGLATHFVLCTTERDGLIEVGEVVLRPGASLSGRLVDEHGAPAAGVLVFAEPEQLEDERAGAMGSDAQWGIVAGLRKTLSDADGRFRLDGLSVGHHDLHLRGEGWLPRKHLWHVPLPGPTDVGELVVGRGHVLEGVVRDAEGQPLPDIELFAVTDTLSEPPATEAALATAFHRMHEQLHPGTGMGSSDDRFAVAGTSDAQGRFRLAGLTAARATLFADGTGWRPTLLAVEAGADEPLQVVLQPAGRLDLHVTHADGRPAELAGLDVLRLAEEDRESTPLPVQRGAAAGHWIVADVDGAPLYARLTADDGLVLGRALEGLPHDAPAQDNTPGPVPHARRDIVLPPGPGVLEGRVVDDLGSPVADARVQLIPAAASVDHAGATWHPRREASTDDDGRYRLAGLPTEAHAVWVDSDGHVPPPGALLTPTADDTLRHDVRLQRAGRIRGRLAAQAVLRPYTHIELRRTPDAAGPEPFGFSLQADRSLHFTSDDLRPGHYVVEVDGIGSRSVVVEAGQTVELVIDTLGSPTLRGRVSSGGVAVAGASVVARYDSAGRGLHLSDHTRSDADGRYELPLTRVRPFELYASTEQGAQSAHITFPAPGPEDQDIDLELPGRRLEGLLVDAETGAIVEHAVVSVLQGLVGRRIPKVSAREGRFRLDHLEAETVTLRVQADGYAPYRGEHRTQERTGDEPLRVALQPGAGLTCRFVDAEGSPSGRSFVYVQHFRPAAGGWQREGIGSRQLRQGRLDLPSLAPGPLFLLFTGESPPSGTDLDPMALRDGALGWLQVDLAPRTSTEHTIVLGEGD